MTVVEHTGEYRFVPGLRLRGQGLPLPGCLLRRLGPEKLRTMVALGGELTIVPSKDGRITPDLVRRMIGAVPGPVLVGGGAWILDRSVCSSKRRCSG